MANNPAEEVRTALRNLQAADRIAAFSVNVQDGRPRVWLNWVGKEMHGDLKSFVDRYKDVIDPPERLDKGYYFLSGDLRPGSGIIRVFGGRPEGPGGTLTCLLSSKDGQEIYFAAAGHVLSNFWQVDETDREGSIYHYRKGFPPTNSTRFLGKLVELEKEPTPLAVPSQGCGGQDGGEVTADIGLVKVEGKVDLKQRTTGYGSLGEWPPYCEVPRPQNCDPVMKCGAQETHWTRAKVKDRDAEVPVFGPDGVRYLLCRQIILEELSPAELDRRHPRVEKGTPFAVPGDSGTIVVDENTKRPVGMLIAGSTLNGSYVVTPFERIKAYWEKRNLVMLRA